MAEGSFPDHLDDLADMEVVYEEMQGWTEDITKARSLDALPPAARKYLERIAQLTGVPISWVGVGPGREDMFLL